MKILTLPLILALVAPNVLALDFDTCFGNRCWTEKFELKGGNYVEHTPNHVCFNGIMCSEDGIDINIPDISFNGERLTPEGLHIHTDSTREEFIEGLRHSGLYEE